MFIDSRNLPAGDTHIQSDVCIVGGGPAGITLARELARCGLGAVLLEAGGLDHNEASQRLAAGPIIGHPYFPLDDARLRRFGGTSNHWLANGGLRSRPLEPEDFEKREWIPFSGWPFGRDHLDPYYARAQVICGLGPYNYDAGYWLGSGTDRNAIDGDDLRTEVFQYNPEPGFREFDSEFADSGDTHVYLNAIVTEVLTDETGSNVTALVIRTLNGRSFRASARVFVLAAGGIENPRLLLASRTRHPAGLGNEHDLVGRFFMEHLHVFSGKIVPQSLDAALIDTYRRRTRQGTDVTGMLTIAPGRRQAERIAGASAILSAEDASSASPGMHAIRELLAARRNNIVRGNLSDVRNSFADREHRAALLRLIKPLSAVPSDWRSVTMTALRHLVRRPAKPTLFQMLLNVEQVPNQRSRVTLAPVRDSLGTFRAELDWRLTTQDRRTIVTTERVIDTSLRAAGTGHLEGAYDGEKPLPLTGSWHHMGTTRMHDDPQQGVVDASSRVHGMSNLYVAGSSVFPTGGYTNPTLTIVALALRLADHLAAEHTKTPTLK